MRGSILIVDDEIELCRMLDADLTRRGFEVAFCPDAEEAMRLVETRDFHVAVADLNLPRSSGLDLCARLAAVRPDLPVVIITAFGSLETAIEAIRAGAYDFITKPFEVDALEVTLDRAVKHRLLGEEVRRLRRVVEATRQFEGMVGESPAMVELFRLVRRVADSEVSVLITGESGTGKEGVARAVHAQGRGRQGPFVAINCAAVPESLLESELFGHVKGAFTDARGDRAGLFVQAHNGTLFLDEIGDLAMGMQPKLLRALQERKVRPLGSTAEVSFDARIIAATNHDLERLVREGRFREDLFFRVQVVRIEVPPLRERGNDVLLLAAHFLEMYSGRAAKPVRGLSSEAAQTLRDYPWPGNVRELQNCIERAVALSESEEITVEDLPQRIRDQRSAPVIAAGPDATLLSLEDLERGHILRVMEAVGGNKTQAARILGLDRKTLYRKLELYGVIRGEPGTDNSPLNGD